MFTNLKELVESMSTEQVCREYLAKQRWPDGKAVCPYCSCGKCYIVNKGKRYRCSGCKKLFSVTVGTVFEDSNIPLTKWFLAVYLIGSHKKGISSYQVAKDVGVSQKSGWFMLHRIREVMREKKQTKLDNIVEVDETWCGGRVTNMSKFRRKKLREEKKTYSTKTIVMGLIERSGKLKFVALGKSNDLSVLLPVVLDNVDKDAVVITDGLESYKGLDKEYAAHEIVNHKEQEYVRDKVFHTNTIEGAFSMLKRSIYGIYHFASPDHLSRYCDETEYRYNTRKMTDIERFNLSLQNCAGRLDYKTLTAKPEETEEVKIIHQKGTVRPIIQCFNGKFIGQYKSIAEAARATGVKHYSIWKVLQGKRGTTGGFEWYYA
jgi:transposase-like protein